jgi:probable phosphoglycerate mutase
MARFLLVRHAAHDYLSRGIAGRRPGISLNETGQLQAQQLADKLSRVPIDLIVASPLQRACETAQPLSQRLGLPIQIQNEFNEIDFGDWTGQTFAELDQKPDWHQWNSFRSISIPPNGESMFQAQTRALSRILQLQKMRPRGCFAIFSHGDVIGAILMHFLGLNLDSWSRFKVDPASLSIVDIGDNFVNVSAINLNLTKASDYF